MTDPNHPLALPYKEPDPITEKPGFGTGGKVKPHYFEDENDTTETPR
jgi:hypothetical protein